MAGYRKGYKIKPETIRKSGVVLFTDGTNQVMPNQKACEAYGFEYEGGVCRAHRGAGASASPTESNNNVRSLGDNNKINTSRNISAVGSNHKVYDSINSELVGDSHDVSSYNGSYANNTAIIGGSYGKATHAGEVVFGGGGGDGPFAGQNQMSTIHLSGQCNGADITIYTQGDDDEDQQILLPKNSISIYELYWTALCTGGSSGTEGHFKTERHLGSIKCANDGTLTINSAIVTDCGDAGTTGALSIVTSTAFTFSLQFTATANVNCWVSAVVKFYTNQTRRATF